MLRVQNYSYGLQPISRGKSLVQKQESMKRVATDEGDSISRAKKQKSEAAAKKHAKAEQLRRKRINTHIQTLKQLLLPNITSKKVKASVLTETIRQVKELRKKAADVALEQYGQGLCDSAAAVSGSFMFPDESDEATVNYCQGGEGKTVNAMICCEDRPGLYRDLTEAIRSVGGKTVRAEMATVGGRTRAEMVVRWVEGGGAEDVGSLTRALKALVESRGFGHVMTVDGHTGLGLDMSTNKRSTMCGSFDSDREWEKLLLRPV